MSGEGFQRNILLIIFRDICGDLRHKIASAVITGYKLDLSEIFACQRVKAGFQEKYIVVFAVYQIFCQKTVHRVAATESEVCPRLALDPLFEFMDEILGKYTHPDLGIIQSFYRMYLV